MLYEVITLLDCKMRGVRVFDLSSFFERARGQVRIDSLRASWLIYGEGFRQGIMRTVVKRFFDLLVSFILLMLALPVMLLTVVAKYDLNSKSIFTCLGYQYGDMSFGRLPG